MRVFNTLGSRIAASAGIVALAGILALSAVLIREQRAQVRNEVMLGSQAIADAILLSLEHATRTNQREYLAELISSVGSHPEVEAVRLFNATGEIMFSSRSEEVGHVVDIEAEACINCHSGPGPQVQLAADDRPRMFLDDHGHRVLGNTREIRNRPGCQGAQCHVSPSEQQVLGVLDIIMPLDAAEARIARATTNAIAISIIAVVLLTGAIFLLVRSSIQRPVARMIEATRRVAQGERDAQVPEGGSQEMVILASSLNSMLEQMNHSQARLEGWAMSLEDAVARKGEELRKAQLEVAQAEKLSSVGMVAAGIAHELNSPLMAIVTFGHLLQDRMEPESQEYKDVQMIIGEANRCAGIIRQLLDFSRKQSHGSESEPVDVGDVVAGAAKILKVELRNRGVDLETDVPQFLPIVTANRAQLMQVLVNLMMNALHAMPTGGSIWIAVDVVPRSQISTSLIPPHPGDEVVRIRVRDTGTGISRKDLRKVFDPFFTTKPVGQGSGLGLSVSLGLIQRYHGTILADSDGQSWTEFTILLPVPLEAPVAAVQ